MGASAVPWEVDVATVKGRLDAGEKFCFVDCRERDEHQLVHIAGATLIPLSELTSRVGELEPYRDQSIVIHCHHGGRSLRAAQWLRQNGFAQAQSMAGGIHQWAEQIEPGMTKY
jgi:rhodanese-related sulfurtransferase